MIAKNEEWNVGSHQDGMAKVKNGGYAFITTSDFIKYEVSQDCELQQIGGLFQTFYYAIGMQKGIKHDHWFYLEIVFLQILRIKTQSIAQSYIFSILEACK